MKDYLKNQGYSEVQINEIMENQKEILENSQIETETTNNTTTEIEKIEKEDTKVETKLDNSGVDNRFKKS